MRKQLTLKATIAIPYILMAPHAGAQDYRPVHFSAPNEQEVYDLLMHANVAYFGYRCKVSEGSYGDDLLSHALKLSNETGVDARVFSAIQSLSEWQFTAAYPEFDDDTPGSAACSSLHSTPAFHEMTLMHDKVAG
ncbi:MULTISPECIES: hypothetical protein [unclassified Shinella]|uniref:hypothetical protein n=1 Tax=unclassified Shinella TaxID=2643062 RepID=UPI00225CC13D|nr:MULTISPECIES: hypothetical protein [unclassified Shinella]MCO5137421.1 hypothetical protein [Shinella sp.]MDC7257401.1 hypothetical protein [Shinella sp. YE25]CAI0340296.1 exported hypothetical protein [Rhizobiaceae bacterium]CAK7258667.1 exported protein of unknown function [Shinella sp. WSC3-e]